MLSRVYYQWAVAGSHIQRRQVPTVTLIFLLAQQVAELHLMQQKTPPPSPIRLQIMKCHITPQRLLHKTCFFFFSLLHKCNMLCIRPQTTPTPTVMPGSGAVTFSHAALQHLLHNLCCDWQASINLGSLCSIIISPAIQLDSTQQHSWHCEASQKKLQVSRQGCCWIFHGRTCQYNAEWCVIDTHTLL